MEGIPVPSLSGGTSAASNNPINNFGSHTQNNGSSLLFPSIAVVILGVIWLIKGVKK